jgi:hypothetical protein
MSYQQDRLNHINAGRPKKEKKNLESWFFNIQSKHWVNGICNCMECGKPIYVAYARCATAHLLAKKLFESISNHPLNYLILCAGEGCHYETDRVDRFIKMKVWPEAARRIREMIPLIPPQEFKHLSSELLAALYP